MRKTSYFILALTIIYYSCQHHASPKREIHNDDFNWTIIIPENFDTMSAAQWAKMQNKGTDAMEKTYGTKVENNAKTIFIFKTDQLNYFESNYQPLIRQ